MEKGSVTFRVLFEDPFWIGLVERVSEGKMTVCKVTFGPEPKEYDVNTFLLENYYKLRFGPSITVLDREPEKRKNPKRAQKEAASFLHSAESGTKSQQALKLLQEQGKIERKSRSRQEKEAQEELRFQLKQQKRKEKHRGH